METFRNLCRLACYPIHLSQRQRGRTTALVAMARDMSLTHPVTIVTHNRQFADSLNVSPNGEPCEAHSVQDEMYFRGRTDTLLFDHLVIEIALSEAQKEIDRLENELRRKDFKLGLMEAGLKAIKETLRGLGI